VCFTAAGQRRAVAMPLFEPLVQRGGALDERSAGDMLPDILREVVPAMPKELAAEEGIDFKARQDRATNRKWKRQGIYGKRAREEAIRVRLEPYCDLVCSGSRTGEFELRPKDSVER